jgi:hypothetical protein
MKRQTLAKRSGLAAALDRGRSDDAPAEVSTPEPTPTKAKTPARFHTSFYPTSRQLYDNVKVALIREGQGRDFNQLVNELLAEWLEAHGEG